MPTPLDPHTTAPVPLVAQVDGSVPEPSSKGWPREDLIDAVPSHSGSKQSRRE